MAERRRAQRAGLTAALAAAAMLAGSPVAAADPAEPVLTPAPAPPPPPATQADAMTPNQQALPPADPAAPPPADPAAPPPGPMQSRIPPVQNQTYGSGQYGGGVLGTLRDLWHQAQNPYMTQDQMLGTGGAPTPPPGAGPAPALPPGYVSTNAPGSETASSGSAAGPATGRPALPPGYYSIDGPPPPGYEYGTPAAPATAPPAPPPPPVLMMP